MQDHTTIKTVGQLKAVGHQPKSIKEELRVNLIGKLQKKKLFLKEFGDMKKL